jgi:NOL1/NOP2/fmu family ribosome biogenesis protein
MKAARTVSTSKSTGFDLVAVKHVVVEEEIAKLGLNLTTRTKSTRRYVHGEAFAAGKAAGALFEPNAVLAS